MRSTSFWQHGVTAPDFAPLRDKVTADVCVIGGGIAGLTTAHLLAEAGLSVAIIEAINLAAGETARSTAHIAIPDDRFTHLLRSFGDEGARQIVQSFGAAIDLIESIVARQGIDCDFRRLDGFLVSCDASPLKALQEEHDAALALGVACELTPSAPAELAQFGPALRFTGQAQFNPFKYIVGLAESLPRNVRIYCGTRAIAIDETAEGVIVRTDGGATVAANAAVVATNTPFNERLGLHLRQYAYQTYAIGALVPKDSLPFLLLWDDGDPYHYMRLAPYTDEHDVLIVGGEDHKTGEGPHADEPFEKLERWTREHFSLAGAVQWRWSGEVIEPMDAIANLGRETGSRNVYVITGDSGNGISHATIGARIVTDLILDRGSPWPVYDPDRSRYQHALEFAKEQTEIAGHYADWLTGGDTAQADAIEPDSGAVIRRGARKYAVYRDGRGDLYVNSATCPHMGCIVQWNGIEKTWDCPCHGSRFTAYGAVLHGPAERRLRAMNEPARVDDLLPAREQRKEP